MHRRAPQAEVDRVVRLDAQRPRGGRAHERRIVPGQLGDRVRRLLQPDVVGEAAVEEAVVGDHVQLEAGSGLEARGLRRRRHRLRPKLRRLGGARRSGDEPVGDPFLPPVACVGPRRPPVLAQLRVRRLVSLAQEGGEHLRLGDAVEERLHQGLHEGDRAVVRARVGPLLERVRGGDEPGAAPRGLVLVEPAVDRVRDRVEGFGEIQIVRRGVDRVERRDHQRVHGAGPDLGRQLPQALRAGHGVV